MTSAAIEVTSQKSRRFWDVASIAAIEPHVGCFWYIRLLFCNGTYHTDSDLYSGYRAVFSTLIISAANAKKAQKNTVFQPGIEPPTLGFQNLELTAKPKVHCSILKILMKYLIQLEFVFRLFCSYSKTFTIKTQLCIIWEVVNDGHRPCTVPDKASRTTWLYSG